MNRHDFKTCQCGKVSVDGGIDYLKRNGNAQDYTEMSLVLVDGRAYIVGEQPNQTLKECIDNLGDACSDMVKEIKNEIVK